MDNSEYKSYLSTRTYEQLLDIDRNLDKNAFPDKAAMLSEELQSKEAVPIQKTDSSTIMKFGQGIVYWMNNSIGCAWVYTIIGIVVYLTVGIYGGYNTVIFLDKAQLTQGNVIEFNIKDESYYPIVQYLDNDGVTREFDSNFGCKPACYSKGEEIEILYLANDESRPQINNFLSIWGPSALGLVVGLAFSFFGIRSIRRLSASYERMEMAPQEQVQLGTKPIYLVLTQKYGVYIVGIWCFVAAVVGVTYVDTATGIIVPVMTMIMFFVSTFIALFMLGSLKNSSWANKLYKPSVYFMWAVGLYSILASIYSGLVTNDDLEGMFFLIATAMFPLGVSVGASKSWDI